MASDKKKNIKVFLSATANDTQSYRNILFNVLKKAELEIINNTSDSDKDTLIKPDLISVFNEAHCSVHILGTEYGPLINSNKPVSIPEYQFIQARNYCNQKNEDFKIFVWQPKSTSYLQMEPEQERFIASIKNTILHNVIISQYESPVILVEDIHTVMSARTFNDVNVSETDVFFIYNELDEETASGIIDLLQDVLHIESFKMMQNAAEDYSHYIVEQVKLSKIVVVFFKWSAEWAIPFVQQLWKLSGGASSQTEILFLGDSNYEPNKGKIFQAPKITSMLIAEELIPLEIKVQFDKLVNTKTE